MPALLPLMSSYLVDTSLFHDESPNGTMLVAAANRTPGIAHSATRSCAVSDSATLCGPMPASRTRTSPSSATPLGRSMRVTLSRMRNMALHTIAQVSAISSTIRPAAVRWRRSVDRIGKKCMVPSLRLELGGGRDLTAAPRGQDAGEQAGDDPKRERPRQHRQIELGELGVLDRLVAHGIEAEPRQAQAERAADEADRAGLGKELEGDRAIQLGRAHA